MQSKLKIVVVGASAGGLQALSRIVSRLPPDFPGAVIAVVHSHHSGSTYSAEILASQTPLHVAYAQEGAKLVPGAVYLARPEAQVLIQQDGRLTLDYGEMGHFTQATADRLFLSAAAAFGSAVIGVVLTGAGNDGTAGLIAIHKRGGICVVQSPGEADAFQMPMNAIQYDDPDFIVLVDEMGPLLERLVAEQRGKDRRPSP